jgi:undecaprenyl diphosphate synthase
MSVVERIRRLRRLRPEPTDPALPESARNVAIIMDGNARWARRRGLPVAAGHRAGTAALKRTVEAAPDLGVRSLCVYAFSTENWTRPDDEVSDLMDLFADTIRNEFADLNRQGVRIRFVGRRDRTSAMLLALMEGIEADTAANARLDLFVAFDYGGRAEIVEACRRIVVDGLAPEAVDGAAIAARLAEPELPEPDLVIRTSGELRLSNFLLWQSAYAELVFSPLMWPEFGGEALAAALAEYAARRRRFGGR